MNTIHALGATDPGLLLVIGMCVGIVFGIAFAVVCGAWGPRPEDEALINPSPRRTSSNRKPGRA